LPVYVEEDTVRLVIHCPSQKIKKYQSFSLGKRGNKTTWAGSMVLILVGNS